MAYKVLTNTLSGWEDCWKEDDKPLRFKTKQEAEEALQEHLKDWPSMDKDEFIIVDEGL